jgi:hypothetical protein
MTRPYFTLPVVAGAAAFLLHLVLNPHYGFFRDELYFIICGRHPQFGYVDQPPIVPLLAAATQAWGQSLVALRAVPALCSGLSIYVVCLLARDLGAGKFGQVLAALAAFFAPVMTSFGMKVVPDEIGLWTWPLMTLLILHLIRGADARLWLAVGALLGVTLESKYTVAFFAVAALIGLIVTPERRVLRTPWFLAGIGIAAVIALPTFLWQAHYGFPMLELLRNGAIEKNVILNPLQYVLAQLVLTNPILSLVWIAGLVACVRKRELRWFYIAFIALTAMMIAFHAKDYYGADVYPALFAVGAAAIAAWVRHPVPRAFIAGIVVVAGLILVPIVEPVLPEPAFIQYMQTLTSMTHLSRTPSEHLREGTLPQDWADMHGWPELAATVVRVYDALPPDERRKAAIVASNYGEAAAIDFFGGPRGLPPVLSGHNQYFLWGPRGFSGQVVIDVHGDCGADAHLFRSARRAAVFAAPYVLPYEDHMPIMVCRGITVPLGELWPKLKRYI